MRHSKHDEIPTVGDALSEPMTAAELQQLASLTGSRPPTRKAELADLIVRHLRGDRLRTIFEGLDEIQQAAVAEVVHSTDSLFAADRFRAKYGCDPSWGSLNESARDARPTPLRCFFGPGVMPADLKARLREFVAAPDAAKVETLQSLPPTCSPRMHATRRRNGRQREPHQTLAKTRIVRDRESVRLGSVTDRRESLDWVAPSSR